MFYEKMKLFYVTCQFHIFHTIAFFSSNINKFSTNNKRLNFSAQFDRNSVFLLDQNVFVIETVCHLAKLRVKQFQLYILQQYRISITKKALVFRIPS